MGAVDNSVGITFLFLSPLSLSNSNYVEVICARASVDESVGITFYLTFFFLSSLSLSNSKFVEAVYARTSGRL